MVTPAEPVLKQKSEDMGSLRGPRKSAGGGGKMDAFEILKQSIPKELGPNADVNKTLNQISSLIGLKMMQLLQIGNTVFAIMPRGGGTAEVHIATVEPLQQLPDRIKVAMKSLKNMGFQRAASYVPSEGWVRVVQQTGLPVKVSKGAQKIAGQSKPMYQLMLDLA